MEKKEISHHKHKVKQRRFLTALQKVSICGRAICYFILAATVFTIIFYLYFLLAF